MFVSRLPFTKPITPSPPIEASSPCLNPGAAHFTCYMYLSKLLHIFLQFVTCICQTRTCTSPHQPPLRPGHHVSIPGQHFQAETVGCSPPFLSLRPFENHEGASILIIRLPPYPHRDTFCRVIQHHMGILVMIY